MATLSIVELIRNGTMSAEMAAVLWAAVDEPVSFLTAALPDLVSARTTPALHPITMMAKTTAKNRPSRVLAIPLRHYRTKLSTFPSTYLLRCEIKVGRHLVRPGVAPYAGVIFAQPRL